MQSHLSLLLMLLLCGSHGNMASICPSDPFDLRHWHPNVPICICLHCVPVHVCVMVHIKISWQIKWYKLIIEMYFTYAHTWNWMIYVLKAFDSSRFWFDSIEKVFTRFCHAHAMPPINMNPKKTCVYLQFDCKRKVLDAMANFQFIFLEFQLPVMVAFNLFQIKRK